MLNYHIKFLTCDDSINLKNTDFKSFKYETKKRLEESVHDAAKRNYYERRGGCWRSSNSRQIRQLESKMERGIVLCEWTNETLITMVFSSGAIAYLTIKPNSLDVTQILFDRYCIGKLAGQTVTGVVLCSSHLMFTHTERMATLITFGKTPVNRIPCRISDRDPHIQNVELGGGSRRTERRVSWCEAGNGVRVLVWSTANAEPAPWSPILEDHANLHLYHIEGEQMYLKAYHQLENETLSADLTQKQNNTVHIIEQITCHQNGVNLEWARYDISSGSRERATKLSNARSGGTRVWLPAPARTARRSPCGTRLLAACIDGSLHLVHNIAGLTHSTKAGFIAADVRWAGELIVAVEEGGRLQCFDRALSLLHNHTKCLDLTSYLRDASRMQILATYNAVSGPFVLTTFNGGPLTLLRITHPRLLTAWLNAGRNSNAVALLRAMDWDEDGPRCLWAVNKIVCAALRSKTAWAAAEESAQAALGAFLAPRAPLAAAAAPAAPAAPPLHDLARKLFHHLLRRGRVETSLSLGVELAAWDLCSDARSAAARRGLHALRDEAALLAAHYARLQPTESDCSGSCSCGSHCSHSYSDSDVETSESSEVAKTEPPPLPRVSLPSLPPQPTLMPVSITQTEPISTNSIRPNLHQYLERDNNVWTNLRDDTIISNGYNKYKPVLTQNMRWHSVDNMLSKQPSKQMLAAISEVPTRTNLDVPKKEEKTASGQFRNMYQTELRDEAPSTTYRYYSNNNYYSNTNLSTQMRPDCTPQRSTNRPIEKNKVKFSNTVTIAVVSDSPVCSETERELADSLPLCPPHKYLAAFAPQPSLPQPLPPQPPLPQSQPPQPLPPRPSPSQPQPPHLQAAAGTSLDYVEV
ncbi:WD repeat-containing and planar cell polarity effector protein fritz isoform X2 [Achroia grisella]|uniref:WD repeat-containing and planar cell polarity effector protein fritz isoform X2 n=1 Tax=Achroia grisella TaxID=688607 RepID=UPI0027D29166|nr:WD repeat-containing and planar cell polarity effector protein fritz isoform X2 [Achroia grisella]